jgi:hypothetical protein
VAVKVIKLDDDETYDNGIQQAQRDAPSFFFFRFDDLASEIEILQLCSSPQIVKYYGSYKAQNELFVRFVPNEKRKKKKKKSQRAHTKDCYGML